MKLNFEKANFQKFPIFKIEAFPFFYNKPVPNTFQDIPWALKNKYKLVALCYLFLKNDLNLTKDSKTSEVCCLSPKKRL